MRDKFKIRKKDKVIVISGRDKGKTGEILRIISGDEFIPTRVLVSKVNMISKHRKPTQTAPGGIQKMEAPIAISKVMLIDPKTDKPTRVRMSILPNGEKVRVSVKTGETID